MAASSSQWEYRPEDAYFKKHPETDITGKTLLGLFYNKEEAYLYPVPTTLIKNKLLKSVTNLHSKTDLLSYNKFDIPIEEKQFVVMLAGDKPNIGELFKKMEDLTVKTYLPLLLDLLSTWNKYDMKEINDDIANIVDGFVNIIVRENTTFWANRHDDMTFSLSRRKFETKDIRVDEKNRETVLKFAADIKDVDEKKRAYDARKAPQPAEYPGMDLDREKKYTDVSEFLLSPLPREDYYKDIAVSEYKTLMESMARLTNSGIAMKLFGSVCCSYKYYHLNLNPYILGLVQRMGAPIISSYYVRYLLFLAYKEESIFRTYSTPEHRHMMDREVSSHLQLLMADSILPGYSPGNSNLIELTFGRRLYNSEETMRRIHLFTRRFPHLQLEYPAKIYICGSIMTAASVRVPPRVRYDVVDGKFTMTGDLLQYRELYAHADIDIMVMVPKGPDGRGDLTYVKMCADLLAERLNKDGVGTTLEPTNLRWRVRTSDKTVFEFFPSFYDPTSLIYKFHVPAVRSYLDPISGKIIDFPSFVYSALSGFCLDYRHFNGSSTHRDVIRKYITRGFRFMLNKEENILLRTPGVALHTPFLGDNYGIVVGRTQEIREQIKGRVLGDRDTRTWTYPINTDIKNIRKQFDSYGLQPSRFWTKGLKHITIPKYNSVSFRSERIMTGAMLPEDIITPSREPLSMSDPDLQTYIFDIGGREMRKIRSNRKQVISKVPILNVPPVPYVNIRIPFITSVWALSFTWTGLISGKIREGQWEALTTWEQADVIRIASALGVATTDSLFLWLRGESNVPPDAPTLDE